MSGANRVKRWMLAGAVLSVGLGCGDSSVEPNTETSPDELEAATAALKLPGVRAGAEALLGYGTGGNVALRFWAETDDGALAAAISGYHGYHEQPAFHDERPDGAVIVLPELRYVGRTGDGWDRFDVIVNQGYGYADDRYVSWGPGVLGVSSNTFNRLARQGVSLAIRSAPGTSPEFFEWATGWNEKLRL